MTDSDSLFAKSLVAYYGAVQAAHIISLLRAAVSLVLDGVIGFPAPPPSGGWSVQANHFLIGMGAADAVNAVIAFVFVYGYFSQAKWWRWVGTLTLGISAYSAVVFLYGTIASGAWAHNPVGYLSISLVFLPVGILMVLFGSWVAGGGFYESRGEQPGNSA